jgi:hypothetical protein
LKLLQARYDERVVFFVKFPADRTVVAPVQLAARNRVISRDGLLHRRRVSALISRDFTPLRNQQVSGSSPDVGSTETAE